MIQKKICMLGGFAVGKTCPGIEVERDVASRIVGIDAPGQEAIERERLVVAARPEESA